MTYLFNVTYEIVTNESAENGDCAESGFIAENINLRDAVRLVTETKSSHCAQECVECDEWPMRAPRWVTVYNGRNWSSGESENRSLHIPEGVTPASRRRIARLVGAR